MKFEFVPWSSAPADRSSNGVRRARTRTSSRFPLAVKSLESSTGRFAGSHAAQLSVNCLVCACRRDAKARNRHAASRAGAGATGLLHDRDLPLIPDCAATVRGPRAAIDVYVSLNIN